MENATGIDVHPLPPVSAMSVSPSRLKSPLTTCTPGVWAHDWAKYPTGALVTVKVPSPLENATGIVYHQDMSGPGSSAMSAKLSLLNLPVTTCTPGTWAQAAKSTDEALVTLKVPSPVDAATGTDRKPLPVSAISYARRR